MILNHVYLNQDKNYHSEHFELLKINSFNFDYNIINNTNNIKMEKNINNQIINISNIKKEINNKKKTNYNE